VYKLTLKAQKIKHNMAPVILERFCVQILHMLLAVYKQITHLASNVKANLANTSDILEILC
jgi:hypothetical protein